MCVCVIINGNTIKQDRNKWIVIEIDTLNFVSNMMNQMDSFEKGKRGWKQEKKIYEQQKKAKRFKLNGKKFFLYTRSERNFVHFDKF